MVYKIIFNIFLLLFSIVSVILIYSKNNNDRKKCEGYEIVTIRAKKIVVLAYAFYIISLIFNILSTILVIINENVAYWVMIGFSIFTYIATIIGFVEAILNFEAYNNKMLYIYRFFKMKEVSIKDIYYIYDSNIMIQFLDKNQRKIYCSNSLNNGTNLIIEKIKEDHYICENNLEKISINYNVEDIDVETRVKYENFGKEYRENKDKRIKIIKLSFLLVSAFILIIITILCISDSLVHLIYVPIFLFIVPSLASMTITNSEKIYKLSDYELGLLRFKECKSYVGHSKYVFNGLKISCIIFIAIGLVMGGFTSLIIGLDNPAPIYSELTKVTGTIEYYYAKDGSKNDYIAFGIHEDDFEYRLDSIYVEEFDFSFKEEIKKGDIITFYVGDRIFKGKSLVTDEECECRYIYYVKGLDKEYFNYDDLIKAEQDNKNVGIVASIVSYSISGISILIMVIGYYYLKKQEKYEVITV